MARVGECVNIKRGDRKKEKGREKRLKEEANEWREKKSENMRTRKREGTADSPRKTDSKRQDTQGKRKSRASKRDTS